MPSNVTELSNCRTVERPERAASSYAPISICGWGPSAFCLSTRLFRNGGPRAGDIGGASVGSPSFLKNLSMLARSVTSALIFMRPPQLVQVSTSRAKLRFISSAHGR